MLRVERDYILRIFNADIPEAAKICAVKEYVLTRRWDSAYGNTKEADTPTGGQ